MSRAVLSVFFMLGVVIQGLVAPGAGIAATPQDATGTPFPRAEPEDVGLSPEAISGLSELVRSWTRDTLVVGAEILVVKDGRAVLHEATGWRDLETGEPMRENSIFRLLALTKPFTGTAALMLVEDGRLDLDAPASRWLPSWRNERSHEVTVRQLLTHTAGWEQYGTPRPLESYPSLRAMVDDAGEHGPQHPPGRGYRYSDVHSYALGALVGEVAGMTVERFIEERILDPLDLDDTHTGFAPDTGWASRVASRYRLRDGEWERAWHPDRPRADPFFRASGGLFSTATDYARWLEAWMAWIDPASGSADKDPERDDGQAGGVPHLLSRKTARTALEPTYGPYGFHWEILSDEPLVFGHGGVDGTHAMAIPSRDLIVVYLTQSQGREMRGRWTRAALNALAPGLELRRPLTSVPAGEAVSDVVELTPSQRARYAGTYRRGQHRVRIFEEDGRLRRRLPTAGTPVVSLVPLGDHTFAMGRYDGGDLTEIVLPLQRLRFVAEEGRVTALELVHDGEPRVVLSRMPPTPASSDGGPPRFEADECPFDTSGIDVETLECGYLPVPENRETDGGRTLRLAVAVAEPAGATEDPVVLLPGGPGGGPLPGFISRVREWIPSDRALVVFDPRGTGYSGPVMCPWLGATYGDIAALDVSLEDERLLRKGAEMACRDGLVRRGIDLDAYNSTTVALDLRDLREALGYDRWNLLAASYGVPFARALMRLDPDGVRSAVLAIGPTQDLSELQTRDVPFFARALERAFEGCAARASCRERYPDLRDEFYRAYDALEERPLTVPVSADDFRSSRFAVNAHDYVRAVYAQLWSESDVPHVPALIRAFGNRDTAVVREVVEREFGGLGSDFSWGMMYSVDCYDAHTPDSWSDFREAAAPFPSPLSDIEFFLRPCPYWSDARASAEERAPLRGSVPTLVLDGEFDPASPPAVGEESLQRLSAGQHVTIPGMGHMPGPRSEECWASVIQDFFERPERRPEADCTEELPEVKVLPELPPWARRPHSGSPGPEALEGVPFRDKRDADRARIPTRPTEGEECRAPSSLEAACH